VYRSINSTNAQVVPTPGLRGSNYACTETKERVCSSERPRNRQSEKDLMQGVRGLNGRHKGIRAVDQFIKLKVGAPVNVTN
jgi:hypothetical protein